ncbi:MAG: hypothetical protein KatS3mg129_2799 [Leptospiraceae bacterium]|nr:MAG: hypothetical protein KatS3mg129_2799 [Leptospiraceae bacterium]
MDSSQDKKKNLKEKEIHPIQFMGIILAIVFEFLGFLLFFGIVGYLIQYHFFQDNPLVLILSMFVGMMIGIYYMYNRAKNLSKIRISKLKKESINQFFYNREKQTKERIEKTRKEIEDTKEKLDKYFKKYEE